MNSKNLIILKNNLSLARITFIPVRFMGRMRVGIARMRIFRVALIVGVCLKLKSVFGAGLTGFPLEPINLTMRCGVQPSPQAVI